MEKNNAQRPGRDFKLSMIPKEVRKSLHILKKDLGTRYLKEKPNMKQKNKDTCKKAREELIKFTYGKKKAIIESKERL